MPIGETWNQSGGLGEIVFGAGEIAMGPYANCFVHLKLIIIVFMLCLSVKKSFFDLVEEAVAHGPSRIQGFDAGILYVVFSCSLLKD